MVIVFKNPEDFRKKLLTNGHSLRSFASLVGLSSPYFSQIINNKRNPSGKVAKKIVDELSLAFDDIFFIQDVSKSDRYSGDIHER
ncbi:MAG: family transcriptional regulator [Bacillus sp. (in: firmicutes)]|nr:family transcriptional regulator [Bacillus sp. (in: firmicutes)]